MSMHAPGLSNGFKMSLVSLDRLCIKGWYLLLLAVTLVEAAEFTKCYSINNVPYCYYTDGSTLSWSDAKQFCLSRNSSLPIITDANIQAGFEKFLVDSNSTSATLEAWLAAHTVPVGSSSKWHWIDGRSTNRQVSVSNSLHWAVEILPSNFTDAAHWLNATDWTHLTGFKCVQFNVTSCEDGVGINTDDRESDNKTVFNSCVREYDEQVTWFTAANRCLAKNSTLAMFDDSSISSSVTPTTHWIGLVKSWWTWPDIGGVDVVYNNFVEWNKTDHDPATTGIPTQFPNSWYDCVTVKSSQWLVKNCTDAHRVVCQTAPVQIPTTPPPTTTPPVTVGKTSGSNQLSSFKDLTLSSLFGITLMTSYITAGC